VVVILAGTKKSTVFLVMEANGTVYKLWRY
jgi:hypothetical protein